MPRRSRFKVYPRGRIRDPGRIGLVTGLPWCVTPTSTARALGVVDHAGARRLTNLLFVVPERPGRRGSADRGRGHHVVQTAIPYVVHVPGHRHAIREPFGPPDRVDVVARALLRIREAQE